jgi:predicted phage terminase large subunit-like protein
MVEGTVTTGSTFENAANLAPGFVEAMRARYEGTRLGRQELYAELLEDVPGALWTRAMIDGARRPKPAELQRVVVAIDPSVAAGGDGAESGIVVAGLGHDGHIYVLDDVSTHASPQQWMDRAVEAYRRHAADCIVAEVNQGGHTISELLRGRDDRIPLRTVHATRGKAVRAEPVSALYEQGKVHHTSVFAALEEQLLHFTPAGPEGASDRADALVWAVADLTHREERAEPHVRGLF